MPLSHHESVKNFFEKAISNEHMVVIFIDEYHNLHITHRPSKATQSGSPGNRTEATLVISLKEIQQSLQGHMLQSCQIG